MSKKQSLKSGGQKEKLESSLNSTTESMNFFSESEMESDSLFKSLLEDSLKDQKALEGKIVKGTVVDIDDEFITVNVSSKSEGRVPLKEFSDEERAHLKKGDEVDVFIERYESRSGSVMLSHQKALQEVTWAKLIQAFEDRTFVKGRILGQVKGGLSVDLGGTIAFLPGSQVDIRPSRDVTDLLGTEQQFLIVKIDEGRGNVVVSRRAVLEEERAADKERLLSELEQGMVVKGIVKNLAPYGAFIDLGGLDGLLHVTDISYKRKDQRKEISETLHVGQEVTVMIIRFNRETKRISLGIKQLDKDAWQSIEEEFKVGQKVKGTITNVTEYGAFVELSEGVEGLIHLKEMSWNKRDTIPKNLLSPGQVVEVMILNIEPARRRISLGLKQCTDNVFESFGKKYEVGAIIDCEVKDVTEFGILVQLPEGVESVIHKMDLSWTLSPEESLTKYSVGDKISAKILNISHEKEIVGLSIKHLQSDPLEDKFAALQKGQNISCKILRILDHGVEVSLGDGVRSVLRRSDLARDVTGQDPSRFQVGETIEAKIMSLNRRNHYVSLSIRAFEREEEEKILAEYSGDSTNQTSGLSSILSQALEQKADSQK
jgi:small subunit ribosomal protein S1